VLCAGCIGSPPALERYRLAPIPLPAEVAEMPAAASERQTLVVEPYATSGIYADPQIVYRLGETTYGAYPNREWALPLGTMLADATVGALRASPGVGAQVSDERVTQSRGLVWRGVVQQFEEVDRGHQVFAAVRLDAAVVRMPGDTVIWQGTAGLERPVSEPSMSAVVNTLSQLSTETIRRLIREAQAAVQTGDVKLGSAAGATSPESTSPCDTSPDRTGQAADSRSPGCPDTSRAGTPSRSP
jgi:uncharacterized lipoprotein YmbA